MPKKKKKAKDLMENEKAPLSTGIIMARPKDKRVCPECGSTRTVAKMLFPGKGLYRLCNNCFKIFDPDGLILLTIGEAEERLL